MLYKEILAQIFEIINPIPVLISRPYDAVILGILIFCDLGIHLIPLATCISKVSDAMSVTVLMLKDLARICIAHCCAFPCPRSVCSVLPIAVTLSFFFRKTYQITF